MTYKTDSHPLPAVALTAWLRARHQGNGNRKLILGEMLRAWRQKRDLSMEESADFLGVDISCVKRLELGISLPSAEVIAAVLVAILQPVSELERE